MSQYESVIHSTVLESTMPRQSILNCSFPPLDGVVINYLDIQYTYNIITKVLMIIQALLTHRLVQHVAQQQYTYHPIIRYNIHSIS